MTRLEQLEKTYDSTVKESKVLEAELFEKLKKSYLTMKVQELFKFKQEVNKTFAGLAALLGCTETTLRNITRDILAVMRYLTDQELFNEDLPAELKESVLEQMNDSMLEYLSRLIMLKRAFKTSRNRVESNKLETGNYYREINSLHVKLDKENMAKKVVNWHKQREKE